MFIKNKLDRFIAKHQYPHVVYANAVICYLRKYFLSEKYIIIDAPCGNGETAYRMSLLSDSQVYGYDISASSISLSKYNFVRSNLFFEKKDIHELFNVKQNCNVVCIINSLFLLPRQTELINKIKNNISDDVLCFVIIPNIYGKNYTVFKKNQQAINSMEHSLEQSKDFFTDNGFDVLHSEKLAYTRNYNRADVKLFSILAPFYLAFLNFFQTLFKIGTPNYFMLVLKRK